MQRPTITLDLDDLEESAPLFGLLNKPIQDMTEAQLIEHEATLRALRTSGAARKKRVTKKTTQKVAVNFNKYFE